MSTAEKEPTNAQIMEYLKMRMPLDYNRHWSYAEVGVYLGKSEDTARRLLKKPGAPRPRQTYDNEGRMTTPVFKASEIVDWWEKVSLASSPSQPPTSDSRREAS